MTDRPDDVDSLPSAAEVGVFKPANAPKPRSPRVVLFLDIDGVLNGHDYDERAQSTTIWTQQVARLNRVLEATGCALVVSSAWRYMVLGGAMTLDGFGYMLRTHGVRCPGHLVGTTGRDRDVGDPSERGRQIKAWIDAYAPDDGFRYAVVDDMQLGFEGMPIVRTDGKRGLTDEDADQLIALLSPAPGGSP